MQNKTITWKDIKHFKRIAFQCHDGIGENHIQLKFVAILDKIRDEYGKKMIVDSGYRTPEWNTKVGGVPDSAHIKGLAADIHCRDSLNRFKLTNIALKYLNRIGIGKDFIHMDIDDNLPHPRMWTYY